MASISSSEHELDRGLGTELVLNSKQKSALEEFRVAAASISSKPDDSDRYYLRWLRARKFDVSKALLMLRNCHLAQYFHARQDKVRFGANTILDDWTPPEVLTLCFPGGFFGEDRGGHPVWYDCMGNLDFRGLHRSVSRGDILKYKCMHAVLCDKLLKEKSAEKGYPIETVSSIVDFENLSFQKHYYWPGLETLKEVLSQVESNCPERIEHVFVIKAPALFPVCYNLVKHIFDEKTRKKIFVFGDNWKEELQQYISPDQLPKAYGGTRCEPDAQCKNYIKPGCDVPQEYYFTNQTETSRDKMDRVLVGRASSHKLTYEVVEGSILMWEFVSLEYDIGFSIFLMVDGQKEKVLLEHRCNSHLAPEVGQHLCKITGKYVLKFDNSYSWTRSKEIFYSVKITIPDK